MYLDNTQGIDRNKINILLERLVDIYDPEVIYLFGSLAWGNPDENSDLDILIIIEESNEKIYKRPIKGIKALRGLKIAKDIMVYTNDEFNKLASDKGSLFYKIKTEGIKLYEDS